MDGSHKLNNSISSSKNKTVLEHRMNCKGSDIQFLLIFELECVGLFENIIDSKDDLVWPQSCNIAT